KLCFRIFSQQFPHHPSLGFDLRRCHGSCIDVERCLDVRVPQEFLHQLGVASVRDEHTRHRVPKRVESSSICDSSSPSSGLKVICHQHIRSRWPLTLRSHARKNQVVVGRIRCFFAPTV